MPASRSLIALLIGTVVFFALWMIALKPSSNNGSKSQGLGALQSDVNSARHAVTTANASQAASAGEKATTGSGGTSTAAKPAKPAKAAKTAATGSTSRSSAKTSSTTAASQPTPATDLSMIEAALSDHKAVALLFFNPTAADDQAVKQEMSSVPTHKGRVLKLEIPANEAGNFTAVTQQVPVNQTPTLLLISRGGDASEIVGYSSPFEIDQRVDDALASG